MTREDRDYKIFIGAGLMGQFVIQFNLRCLPSGIAAHLALSDDMMGIVIRDLQTGTERTLEAWNINDITEEALLNDLRGLEAMITKSIKEAQVMCSMCSDCEEGPIQ